MPKAAWRCLWALCNVAAADLVYLQGADAVTHYASSPGVERTFCKVCGSNLTWRLSDAGLDGARVAVTSGTFDTPYEGKVTHELHTDSKPGWLP
ncbi:MAG: GFA family protein [Bdellovibrionales bacterium]|nr:GFA family protein [Massilia sp.]